MNAADIRPTMEQIEWSDCEIGVMITYDLTVFRPPYEIREHYGDPIPASVFNPTKLDTDQWMAASKSLGAKYAVLVAKHGTGFTLCPTSAIQWQGQECDMDTLLSEVLRDKNYYKQFDGVGAMPGTETDSLKVVAGSLFFKEKIIVSGMIRTNK